MHLYHYVIYHHKDLDGIASGALGKIAFEEATLIGYHYNEPFDIKKFKNKNVIMADVSLNMDDMFKLAEKANELNWIDHHVSAFNDFVKKVESLDFSCRETKINSLISEYFIPELNFYYYYSPVISACELMRDLHAKPILSRAANKVISLLGQYDTWRDVSSKKIIGDEIWEKYVFPFQWGMRKYRTPESLINVLENIKTTSEIDNYIEVGKEILDFQEKMNLNNYDNFGFEFDLNFLGKSYRVIAMNSGPFNSSSFKDRYHEDLHDIMMPFVLDVKNDRWNFSMYTTKEDVDILSIAKHFGGGGHKQACGFQRKTNEVSIIEGNIFFEKQVGLPFLEDLRIPEDTVDLKKCKNIKTIPKHVKQLQDENGHWYWIPLRTIKDFKNKLSEITGKEYMDCPDKFDEFNDKFSKYMTGGDKDLEPEFYKQKRKNNE